MDAEIPREVLCADEVAQWFGLDRKTVYAAVARGEIPHRRVGKRVLFHRNALLAWLTGESTPRKQ
jgi:excisionase family DNA binding protein